MFICISTVIINKEIKIPCLSPSSR